MNSTDDISEDLIQAALMADVMIVIVIVAGISFVLLSK